MLTFDYQLSKENIRDMNGYLAIHDKNIQQKSLTLSIAFAVLFIIVTLLITGLTYLGLGLSVAEVILSLIFFPKIYWQVVFKRISNKIDENTNIINFHPIHVEIGDEIAVKSDGASFKIKKDEIMTYDFTKETCLIFYHDQKKNNTLIIPVAVIGDKLSELNTKLGEMIADANKSTDSE